MEADFTTSVGSGDERTFDLRDRQHEKVEFRFRATPGTTVQSTVEVKLSPTVAVTEFILEARAATAVFLRSIPQGCEVRVRADNPTDETSNIALHTDDLGELTVLGVEMKVQAHRAGIRPQRLEIGRLTAGLETVLELDRVKVRVMRLNERVTMRGTASQVEVLELNGQVELSAADNPVGVETLRPAASPKHGATTGQDISRARLTLQRGSALTCSDLVDVDIVIPDGAALTIEGESRNISLAGLGSVEMQRGNSVEVKSPSVKVKVRPHGQVLDMFGQLALHSAPRGHISGRRGSGDGGRLSLVALPGGPGAYEGLSITEISIPVTLQGREVLSVLGEQAEFFSPAVTDELPGRGRFRGAWNLVTRRTPRLSPADAQLQVEYSVAIADLAQAKGAPASVRTSLAWSAYRMRNLTAPGRVERGLLSLYRLIGYGERAVPAVLSYIAVAVVVTVVSMRGRPLELGSSSGYREFVATLLDWLATPLHVLNLTGSAESVTEWGTFGRLLIAIPFATAILALRNYVKARHR